MLLAYRRQPRDRPNQVCVSCTPQQNEARLIFFTERWKALLHPNQSGLGSALLVCRRHVSKVGALTQAEIVEFHKVFSQLERALESTFGASLVNLSCERNWAYREQNPDPPFLDGQPNPHVHWHVVPRYKQIVRFMGIEWEDPTFGQPFVWRKKGIPPEVTLAIIRAIRRKLPIEYLNKG